MNNKIERINSSLVKEISYILETEIKDNDIKFVTITDAKVTNDLSFAKIYVTILNKDKKKQTMNALKNASGYIRSKLYERIDIRHIPELIFVYDESIAYANKIEQIIDDLHDE